MHGPQRIETAGGTLAMAEVSEFFANVSEKVNKDKIQGMNVVYQFDITGDTGGQYAVVIADNDATVQEGVHESPNITLTISDEDFKNLTTGKLNGQTAFLTGKLKIKGDMALAMKLQSVFSFS